ncbi:MAG TPA: thiamine-phosphate kinase [Geminicoccaceae bacterium]
MSLGEFGLIDRLLRPLAAGFPGALGLADDAALVRVPAGRELVVAKDAIVAGVHFLEDDPPELVAGKLLRVNLSDLAAMGAEPLGYLTALARPKSLDDQWLARFAAGLAADQARFGCHLLGGDTVSTPGPLLLSLTILGTVPEGRALLRSGARPGDQIWVSGTLGDAALGLRVLKGLALPDEEAIPLVDRYRTPRTRLELGRALRGLATAAIDVSDGLVADLGHIAETSRVAAVVDADALPLSEAGRGVPAAREAALTGGDDYELLFTVPDGAEARIAALSRELGLRLTRVGRIEPGAGVRVLDAGGEEIRVARAGWSHF